MSARPAAWVQILSSRLAKALESSSFDAAPVKTSTDARLGGSVSPDGRLIEPWVADNHRDWTCD
jgi:hypothetical protein